jgi:hypothetical protein
MALGMEELLGRTRRSVLLGLLLMLLFSASAFGDFADFFYRWSSAFSWFADDNSGQCLFPILAIPMGGRYEGMGTAFAAVADEGALLEANPAGSSTLAGPELSLYHHNWIADGSVEGLAFCTRFRNFGYGFGAKLFYEPFSAYDGSGRRTGKGYFIEALATANASGNLLPQNPWVDLSVGVNLKGLLRYVSPQLLENQSAVALPFDVGLLGRFRLPSRSLGGGMKIAVAAVLHNLGQKVQPLDYPLPTMFSVGLAYAPRPPLLFSLDVNLPVSFETSSFSAGQPDLAFGTSLRLTRFLSLHGGVHLVSDNPRFTLGGVLKADRTRFTINYNADLMGGLNPVDLFSAAVTLDLANPSRESKSEEVPQR